VHRRYLVPLAGHAAVTTVVLNQVDTLSPDQAADCASDLRRLLDAEGLTETPVYVTSAITGAGLDELRRVLASAVAARRAVTDRITADIDALLERFAIYAGDSVPGWLPPEERAPQPQAAPAVEAAAAIEAIGGIGAIGVSEGIEVGAEPAAARISAPPWEQADSEEPGGNGGGPPASAGMLPAASPAWPGADPTTPRSLEGTANRTAGGSDVWQPWQTIAAPPRPAPSARPPWEDATPDGNGARKRTEDPASYVPAGPAGTLTAALAKAAGVAAVTETLNGVRERSAAGYIGWPPARLAARLRGRAPAHKLLAGDPRAAGQAQRSDIDNAITVFADKVSGSLPEPWSRTVRAAARSRADEAQAALGAAVAQGLPRRDRVTGWWRLIALTQWLLMLLMLAGLIWIGLILGFGESHAVHKPPSLIGDVSLAPWLGVIVVALLLLGWLISSWCQNMVVLAADRERELAVHAIMSRIATVASDLVLIPTGRELSDYERFRAELAAARDNLAALPTAPSAAAPARTSRGLSFSFFPNDPRLMPPAEPSIRA
jgi:hypothetical protein